MGDKDRSKKKRNKRKIEHGVAENVDGKKKRQKKEEADENGESKMSKRQMKREKHAQRLADAEVASHKAVRSHALNYLSLWKHNRAEWKFNKVKQIWLYKHKFDPNAVPEELWPPLLEYFTAAQGGIKQSIVDDCQKLVEGMEAWLADNQGKDKPSDAAYARARDLLQNVQC